MQFYGGGNFEYQAVSHTHQGVTSTINPLRNDPYTTFHKTDLPKYEEISVIIVADTL